MYPIKSTLRLTFAATTLALATSAYAQINDSIRGAASEANHFVETPKGWKNPMMPWGEPDIRAKLDMMQASGVPLERCANSYRPGAPPVRPEQEMAHRRGIQAARRGRRGARRPKPTTSKARQLRRCAARGSHGSEHPATADQPDRRSAERDAAGADARREEPRAQGGQRLGAAGREHQLPVGQGFRQLGPLRHARLAVDDDAVSLQRRIQNRAGAGLRRVQRRDDPRGARHPDGRSQAARSQRQAVSRCVARPLGGDDARRGDDQLPHRTVGQPTADQLGRGRVAGRQPVSDQRQAEDHGADRAAQRQHLALRDQDGGP